MNIKRFVAKDMQEAFSNIKQELGSDAVILNNRSIRKKGLLGLFSKPMVEVYVGYDIEEPQNKNSGIDEDKYKELEDKLNTLSGTLSAFNEKIEVINKISTFQFSAEVENIYFKLVNNDVSEEAAQVIAKEIQTEVNRYGSNVTETARKVLRLYLGEPYELQFTKKKKVAVIMGPTGVGKTTTIAKLAAHIKNDKKLKVGLITADAYRIAAHEQLKTYADILEIPICCIFSPAEVKGALNNLKDNDVILIDTPGVSPGNIAQQQEIKDIIEISRATDIYLSIVTSSGFSSSRRVIDSYSFLKDYRLIITKLDEAVNYGGIVNIKYLSKRPIAFLTTGQSVPGNLKYFNPDEVVKELLDINS